MAGRVVCCIEPDRISRPKAIRWGAWPIAAIAAFSLGPAFARADLCDPGLLPRLDHPLAYAERGDRCEGVYIGKVSGADLRLMAFTRATSPPSDPEPPTLTLRWDAPERHPVRLRAHSLLPRRYYRMDTRVPAASDGYTWPLDVVTALDLPVGAIGLLGWYDARLGAIDQRIYLPVRLGNGAGAPDSAYRVDLLPGRELAELFVAVLAYEPETGRYDAQGGQRPLNYGYYPAGRVISLSIDRPPAAGLYLLRVGATVADGGAASLEVWFQQTDG